MTFEEKLEIYEALLRKWQGRINLISSKTLDHIWERHFEDSMALLPVLKRRISENSDSVLYDLGSGAGFPGLIIAMAMPDVEVHLVESDNRKCEFLRTVSRETLTPVTLHNIRAESLVSHGNPPDFITARAFAPLGKIFELTQTWAQNNSDLVYMLHKGRRHSEEVREAETAFRFKVEAHDEKNTDHALILEITDLRRISVR